MQNGDNNDARFDDDDPPPGNESNNNDTHSDNDDDESGNISAEDVVLKNYQVQETKIKYPVTSINFATKDFKYVAEVAMQRYLFMKNACSVGHSVPLTLLKMVLSFALVSCSDAINQEIDIKGLARYKNKQPSPGFKEASEKLCKDISDPLWSVTFAEMLCGNNLVVQFRTFRISHEKRLRENDSVENSKYLPFNHLMLKLGIITEY